jgi:hypothetical protein
MRDDLIREVLRSPLDDPPPRRRARGVVVLAFVAAAVLAAATTLGAEALMGDRGDASSDDAATTTEAPVAAAPGPVQVGSLIAEVAWAYDQGSFLYLSAVLSPAPGTDPSESAGITSAHWVLRLADGQTLTSVSEETDPATPGIFTIGFPQADLTGGAELLMYPVEDVTDTEAVIKPAAAAFPWEGLPDGGPYPVGGDTLVVEALRLDDAGGELRWRLTGSSVTRAVVRVTATYAEAGGEAQAIVGEDALPADVMRSARTRLSPTRQSTLRLYHLDDPQQPSSRSRYWGDAQRAVDVIDVEVTLSIRAFRYVAEPVVIPFLAVRPVSASE